MKITKRHLPHIEFPDSTYFITTGTKTGHFSKKEQLLILEHIKDGNTKFYVLLAVIVMKNHFHILLIPKGHSVSNIMKGIKGVTARKINMSRNKGGSIWQEEYFDKIVRDEKDLNTKLEYMLFNPVKNGYTDNPYEYYGWYLNENYLKEI